MALFKGEREKEYIICVRYVPSDHRLSSLGKPRDDK